jgi:hypothetical protein
MGCVSKIQPFESVTKILAVGQPLNEMLPSVFYALLVNGFVRMPMTDSRDHAICIGIAIQYLCLKNAPKHYEVGDRPTLTSL